MASIGRLAAGVAHEINNPLAVINEKAGFIQDLLSFMPVSEERKKLQKQTDAVIQSVKRCSTITHRLLGLARPTETFEPVAIREILQDVIGFLEKEASRRTVSIAIDTAEDLPKLPGDKFGSLCPENSRGLGVFTSDSQRVPLHFQPTCSIERSEIKERG